MLWHFRATEENGKKLCTEGHVVTKLLFQQLLKKIYIYIYIYIYSILSATLKK